MSCIAFCLSKAKRKGEKEVRMLVMVSDNCVIKVGRRNGECTRRENWEIKPEKWHLIQNLLNSNTAVEVERKNALP